MDLRDLFKSAENTEEFQAGATIFEEKSTGSVMYVVLDGEVEVRRGARVIEVIESGNIVGEMALIDPQFRSATAVAKSDCRLAIVDEKRFLFMVQQTPFFALHVMRILVNRLRRMTASQMD
jgi:CRP/FNR family transcriptional regulator, cyclic AMP receptor protein